MGSTLASLVRFSVKRGEVPITLKVLKQKEEDVHYRMGRNLKLGFLMEDYCDRMGLVMETVRFLFDGSRIGKNQTPQDLNMEDDDIIDAMTEEIGG